MADHVRYILDKLAKLFNEVRYLKLFSEEEIKSIIQKTTNFEYTLKRSQLSVTEYKNYLQYAINLDKLHLMRVKKMKNSEIRENNSMIKSIKASFIRHVCYIFDRALRRFPAELELWKEYLLFLKEKKSTKMLNSIFGKILALHPKIESFWLEASIHELETNGNVKASRTILQRGLRVNQQSEQMWLRYFQLELWSAVRIMERRRQLGIKVSSGALEENSDVLQGVPMIVFKHALAQLPQISSVLSLYKTVVTDFPALAAQMEMLMREKHGVNKDFWTQLCRCQVEASYESSISKVGRKRGEGYDSRVAYYRVVGCTEALEKCLEVNKQYVGLNAEDEGFGSIMIANIDCTVRTLIEGEFSQKRGGNPLFEGLEEKDEMPLKKSKKMFNKSNDGIMKFEHSSEDEEEEAEGENETQELETDNEIIEEVVNEKKLSEANERLEKVFVDICSVLKGFDEKNVKFSEDSEGLKLLVCEFLMWRFSSLFEFLNKLPKKSVTLLSAKDFVEGLLETANSLSKIINSRKPLSLKNSSTKKSNQKTDISAFVTAVNTFLDFYKISSQTSVQEPLGKLISAIGPFVSFLLEEPAGEEVLNRILKETGREGELEFLRVQKRDLIKNVVGLISSTKNIDKGPWCCHLIQSGANLLSSENSTNTNGKRESTSDNNKVLNFNQVLIDVHWVLNCLQKKPQGFIASDLLPFYSLVDSMLNSASSAEARATHLLVLERAVESYPEKSSLWESLAALYRVKGEHKRANHVLWRREKAKGG